MSHSRQTEHYELPLYDGNDIINPLTDFNNANSSIDEALYNANQRSVQAENTANDAKDIAEGYDTRVSQAIQTADDAITLANNTQDMIADDFDPNKTGGYNVGDFVIYNGKLYRFINAHTGAWDASDVQVSPVLIEAIADVVDEGKQDIADAVEEAEQEIAGQTEKVTKTQAMIAQPFDANKSGGYAVGDVVTYADKLYKFTSAHSGVWTGLDVEQVDVVDTVDEKIDLSSYKKVFSKSKTDLSSYITTDSPSTKFAAPKTGWYYMRCLAGPRNPLTRRITFGTDAYQFIGTAPSSDDIQTYITSPLIYIKQGELMYADGDPNCDNYLYCIED